MAKKICIDPGHYGSKYNRGTNPNYYESNFTWQFSHLLADALKARGFEVIITRKTKEEDPSLYNRGYMSKGCACFISIHSNATGSGGESSVTRPVGIYLVDRPETQIDDESVVLAKGLAKVVQDAMGFVQNYQVYSKASGSDRDGNGKLDDNYYGVLNGCFQAGTPGIILEHSFHTNTAVCNWLMDENNLKKMAAMEADWLQQHYKTSPAVETPVSNAGTKIMGSAEATAEQMQEYIKKVNPSVAKSVIDMIPHYLSEGKRLGVRGDIAFAQSCLETGNFAFAGSAVTLDQNNFCGMGVTSTGMKGNSFDTPQLGIRAQVQHLFAYASTDQLKDDCIDPRFKYVRRGSAPYVEWLGIQENPQHVGWASGANYGVHILDILARIKKTGTSAPATPSQSTGQNIVAASGFLKVTYQGADGVNVRKQPCFGDNVDQVLMAGPTVYTIVGKSADGKWYQLKSGLFITTGSNYVTTYKTLEEALGTTEAISFNPYLVRVKATDLNIRTGPDVNTKSKGYTGKGTFTIIAEKEGPVDKKGNKGLWGLLKSYSKNRDGWICLSYTTRV